MNAKNMNIIGKNIINITIEVFILIFGETALLFAYGDI